MNPYLGIQRLKKKYVRKRIYQVFVLFYLSYNSEIVAWISKKTNFTIMILVWSSLVEADECSCQLDSQTIFVLLIVNCHYCFGAS